MIVGLGTDIIDNRRIENAITKFGLRFKKKCLRFLGVYDYHSACVLNVYDSLSENLTHTI